MSAIEEVRMNTEYKHELISQIDLKEIRFSYKWYVRELLVCLEGEGCVTLQAAEERLTEKDFLETMQFEEGPYATLLGKIRNIKKMNRPCYDGTLAEALRVIRLTKERQE